MEIALELIEAAEHRVDVCILEGRQDHSSPDVDAPRRGGRSLGHLVEGANCRDPVIRDQDRLGRAARSEIDRSSGQEKIAHRAVRPSPYRDPEQRFNIPL
jgi:hypothetical protein